MIKATPQTSEVCFDYERKKTPEKVQISLPSIKPKPALIHQPSTPLFAMENLSRIQSANAEKRIFSTMKSQQLTAHQKFSSAHTKVKEGLHSIGRIAEHNPSMGIPEKMESAPQKVPLEEKKDPVTEFFNGLDRFLKGLFGGG